MSIDRSLRIKGALKRHRNVLSREERINRSQERGTVGRKATTSSVCRRLHTVKSARNRSQVYYSKLNLPLGTC